MWVLARYSGESWDNCSMHFYLKFSHNIHIMKYDLPDVWRLLQDHQLANAGLSCGCNYCIYQIYQKMIGKSEINIAASNKHELLDVALHQP